jgi:hypothetical protein
MLRNSRSLKIISACLCIPLLGSIAASLVHPDAAVAGGFSRTCLNERIEFDESTRVVLVAGCKDKANSTFWSDNGHVKNERRLIISDFIANYGGKLAWAHNGSFQASCKDIQLKHSRIVTEDGISETNHAELHAICGDGKGGWNGTHINLDEKISNQDGVLDVDDF